MIDARIVELEQKRLESLGYDTVVTPIEVPVNRTMQEVVCGNDTYVLTGIRVSNLDVVDDATKVTLTGPNESLEATQRTIATMSNSLNKLFRHYIIIKTNPVSGYVEDTDYEPYALEFIKITPIRREEEFEDDEEEMQDERPMRRPMHRQPGRTFDRQAFNNAQMQQRTRTMRKDTPINL